MTFSKTRTRARLGGAIAVATLAVALAGCAGGGGSDDPSGAKVVHIASLFDTTGAGSPYSLSAKDGFDLALDLAKKNDKLHGATLDITTGDTGGVPQKGATLAQQVISSDADIAVYGTTSVVAEAMGAAMQSAKLPFVISQATTKAELAMGDYVFLSAPTYETIHKAFVEYLVQQKVKSLAVLYDADSASYKALAETAFPQWGKENGFDVKLYPTTIAATDFTTIVRTILATSPDAIYLPVYDNQYATIAGLLHQADYRGIVGTHSSEAALLPTLSPSVVESMQGNLTVDFWSPALTCEGSTTFVKEFTAKYGKEPNSYAAGGYNVGLMVAKAIEQANGKYSRSSLQAAMSEVISKGLENTANCSLPFDGREPKADGVLGRIEGTKEVLVEVK